MVFKFLDQVFKLCNTLHKTLSVENLTLERIIGDIFLSKIEHFELFSELILF